MRRLYFHHIPKTGGTALTSLIEMHVPRELICPATSIDELRTYHSADLKRFAFFRGTFANELVPLLPEPPVRVTLLRDPVERAISQHLMNARLSETHEVTPASEAIHDPTWEPIFGNYMARYLVFEFTDAVCQWDPPSDPPHHRRDQAKADYYPLDTSRLREQALGALLSFDIVGITNNLYECYESVCRFMGWEGRVAHSFRNTGDAREALRQLYMLSEPDFDLLLSRSAVDFFLYEVAKQLVRLRIIPALVP